MRLDSYLLLAAGAAGSLLGLAALVTGVQGIAAVLCALVFGAAATCLYVGWRFWTDSPLTRYRQRCHVTIPASHAGKGYR